MGQGLFPGLLARGAGGFQEGVWGVKRRGWNAVFPGGMKWSHWRYSSSSAGLHERSARPPGRGREAGGRGGGLAGGIPWLCETVETLG